MDAATNRQQASGFKDKRIRLFVLGVMQSLVGVLLLLFTALATLGTLLSATLMEQPGQPHGIAAGVTVLILYGSGSAWSLVLGLGSISARRWARSLTLATSWVWLVSGFFYFITFLIFTPSLVFSNPALENFPTPAANLISALILIFMVFVMVIAPGMLVLLYSGPHVRGTCEHYNPKPCWTDRSSIPLLAGSFLFVILGLFSIPMMLTFSNAPFFGLQMPPPLTVSIALLASAAALYIAWGFYAGRMKAWWAAAVFTLLFSASNAMASLRFNLAELSEAVGLTEQELEIFNIGEVLNTSTLMGMTFAWLATLTVFLLYTKQYFRSS